ncbi:hypothetical protein [Phenylobacterium sp.]|jgi:uncharacterized membrane protein|uniref:DUF4870 family protein n=1 Tax=Phenylobacterium sp. TaxID=1871053 RepID=UPI002E30DDB6|nr:hypothetical protein [Phenylobacterium sp.]HEX2561645.1 hypothetical protein [Phenylobacterium sp.]
MTDHTHLPPPQPAATADERTLPIVTYALYLGGFLTGGLTPIIGVIIAHAGKDNTSWFVRSHYQFLIRTFWITVLALLAGGAAMGVGVVLSIILIGIPIMVLAGLFMGLVAIWFAVRSVVGLIYAVQNQPYPKPETWLI